jgi:hypothetical protein
VARKADGFFKRAVVFTPVATGSERETLRAVVDHLSIGLGYPDVAEELFGTSSLLGTGTFGTLSNEDERLVVAIRNGLTRLASAIGAAKAPGGPKRRAVEVALDGAELVVRGELVQGNQSQLGALIPSLVFMVTVPIIEQDEAIELSRRTSALIQRTLAD